jgi:transcriptional regulator with XRE-family HTH domain
VSPKLTRTLHHRQSLAFRRLIMRLARRIKELRAARGWTVEHSAERCGVEPAHVRRLERGRGNPSLAVLVSIAAAFDIDVAKLLEW